MVRMRRIIFSLMLAVSFQLAAFGCCRLFAENKIVAVVNNDVITQKDLDDFVNFLRMQMVRQYTAQEAEKRVEAMKRDLLDKLIEDRLIVQEAKKNNLRVDESRIKAKILEIKSNYPSDAQFQDELARQGMVLADLEDKIRDQMMMYNIVEYKIREKIVVNPDEVTNFYNGNPQQFISLEEREALVVALENADLAKTFVYNFRRGEELEGLAARYPLTVDRLSAVKNGELNQEIEEAIFKLNISEISDPVKIADKYYVFRLDNVVSPRQLTLKEVRHKVYSFLFEKKTQEELVRWLDELKKQSYVKIY